MAPLRAIIRRTIRISAAKFVVATGAEKGSDSPVSVLLSGTDQQLAYFQGRIGVRLVWRRTEGAHAEVNIVACLLNRA